MRQITIVVAAVALAHLAHAQPPPGCSEIPRTGEDEQLFRQAVETGRQDPKEAIKLYWELIKRHPASSHAPVAWLQLGEYFFSARKQPQAIKAFTKALETRKTLVAQVATIRLAELGQEVDAAAARSTCQTLLAGKNCGVDQSLLDAWGKICAQPGQ